MLRPEMYLEAEMYREREPKYPAFRIEPGGRRTIQPATPSCTYAASVFFSRRNSCSGRMQRARPQSKQIVRFRNTNTPGLSRFFSWEKGK